MAFLGFRCKLPVYERCSILDRLPIRDGKVTSLDEVQAAQKHLECLTGSFEKSIIESAKNALEDGDRKIITRLINHLALHDVLVLYFILVV